MVKVFTANGSDEALYEGMRAWLHKASPINLEPWLHRLIQQINRLLEPLILYECRICLFSGLDRSMAKQVLNISDSNTSTQQSPSKRLPQIV